MKKLIEFVSQGASTTGSGACSIFCTKADGSAVLRSIEKYQHSVHLDGDESAWNKAEVLCRFSKLSVSTMVRIVPQDKFCHVLLGTLNFVRNIVTPASQSKETVFQSLVACAMMVGITAVPAFSADEKHGEILAAIAESLDGMIFNGSGFMNFQGELLIDVSGASDCPN